MITSRSNPLVKQARALRQRRARQEARLFLIEGLRPLGAAIEAGWEIEAVLYAPEMLKSAFGQELVSRLGARSQAVSAAVLQSIAEKDKPQGIIAIAKQRHHSFGSFHPAGCAAAMVCPQDPGNVGTVLRTLDAVGGSALYLLDGGVDPYHPTIIRAGMGATFMIPVVEGGFEEFREWRCRNQVQLIGTSARAESHYREAVPRVPWVLLLGSEQKGLSEDQKRSCDVVVSLPMRRRTSSLNLAVAAGILLFAYCSPEGPRTHGSADSIRRS